MNFYIGRDATTGLVNGKFGTLWKRKTSFFCEPKTFVSTRCSNISYKNQQMNQDFKTFLVLQSIDRDLLKKPRLRDVLNFSKSSLRNHWNSKKILWDSWFLKDHSPPLITQVYIVGIDPQVLYQVSPMGGAYE